MSLTLAPHLVSSLLVILGWGACASPSGVARSEPDVVAASGEVELGMDHYRAGRFEEAVESFARAQRRVSHPSLVWNTARAYEELGDVAAAAHHFQAFVRRYPTNSYAERANAKLDTLRPRVTGSGGP